MEQRSGGSNEARTEYCARCTQDLDEVFDTILLLYKHVVKGNKAHCQWTGTRATLQSSAYMEGIHGEFGELFWCLAKDIPFLVIG